MLSIPISEFREKLQYYLKKAFQGERLEITSHGKTLAEIGPPNDIREAARARLREIAKTAWIGDVVSPANDIEDWNVMKDDFDLSDTAKE